MRRDKSETSQGRWPCAPPLAGIRASQEITPHAAEFSYQPCSDDYVTAYLNRADVQRALHARSDVSWKQCGGVKAYSAESKRTSMIPVLMDLINHGGLRIMIMSGNEDSVVPSTGDQHWIWDTGLDNTEPWRRFKLDGQVAGYTTNFTASSTGPPGGDGQPSPPSGFRYTVVNGAGHMIPMTQPKRSAHVVRMFLSGEW